MSRDLQDVLSFAPLQSQKFSNFRQKRDDFLSGHFAKIGISATNLVVFRTYCDENVSEFHEISYQIVILRHVSLRHYETSLHWM